MYKQTLTYQKNGDGYRAQSGFFALAAPTRDKKGFKRVSEWHGCREEFDDVFNKRQKQILFCDGKHGDRVAAFIAEIEKRLKVKPPSKIIGFHNCSDVCCVQFSRWWVQNNARWSLFTILLRCGLNYAGDFKRALASEDYIKTTQEAVDRFFAGYTNCSLKMNGWEGWVYFFDKEEAIADYDLYEDDCEEIWQKRLNCLTKPRGV